MSEDSLKIIISNPNITTPTCIICLLDTPTLITYSGNCNCHPQIHEQCLGQWFIENSNTCPICRHKSESRMVIVNEYHQQRPTRIYMCCCLCFFSICIIPFAIIIFISIFKNKGL